MSMRAYNGDPDLKARFVAEIVRHREEDRLIRGDYGGDYGGRFRGCAVGCAIHSMQRMGDLHDAYGYADHSALAAALGMPAWLWRLADHTFEALPRDEYRTWPERLAQAIPVGADLSRVEHLFIACIMQDCADRAGSMRLAADRKAALLAAIKAAIALHENAARSVTWDADAARRAAKVAENARTAVDASPAKARRLAAAAEEAAAVDRVGDASVASWTMSLASRDSRDTSHYAAELIRLLENAS